MRGFKRYPGGKTQTLDALREIACAGRTRLMGYEADVNRCQRTFIAESVVANDDDILHIPLVPYG